MLRYRSTRGESVGSELSVPAHGRRRACRVACSRPRACRFLLPRNEHAHLYTLHCKEDREREERPRTFRALGRVGGSRRGHARLRLLGSSACQPETEQPRPTSSSTARQPQISMRPAEVLRSLGATLLLVLLASPLCSARLASWDLAVTAGNEIDFIARNGNLTETKTIANASTFVGIAYDEATETLFLSDSGDRDYSIVSMDLSKNTTAKPLLKRDKDSQILSMAFDSTSRKLFWTTERSILTMQLGPNGQPIGQPLVLHALDAESPRAIALDVCNRNLYWVNGNRSRSTIMRSRLDGSEVRLLVSEELYYASSIVVDQSSGRLYWLDDEEGIHYKLEQSELDGSGRSVLVHGKHQEPMHLAVDRERLYWTDKVYGAVWEIGKQPGPAEQPRLLRGYTEFGREADPTSLLARGNRGSALDCQAMRSAIKARAEQAAAPRATGAPSSGLASRPAATVKRGEPECYNGGSFDEASNGSCRCRPGFSGWRCELSACHNYCLRGKCRLSEKGLPICACEPGHAGSRCERELCNGFCLNNGLCQLDEEGRPSCECKYSSGPRCEVTLELAEVCALFCMNRQFQMTGVDTTSCRCSDINETVDEVLGYDSFNGAVLVPVLSGLLGMLTIAVVLLSVYVMRLRRRPRIKKRFVVNKAGITPLTSRPSPIAGDQQCEITIENCCNMNICETPCFEPKLRSTSGTRTASKKEEKSNLLDHMEDGSGGGC